MMLDELICIRVPACSGPWVMYTSYNESVHIIDFEAACVGSDAVFAGEMSEVEKLLEKVKNEISQ